MILLVVSGAVVSSPSDKVTLTNFFFVNNFLNQYLFTQNALNVAFQVNWPFKDQLCWMESDNIFSITLHGNPF